MTAVQARSPVVEYRKRRAFNPLLDAEKYFKKQANGNQPRVLDDVSKESIEAAVANLLPPEPPASPIIPVEETPQQKVFRLVGERRFEEAARLAKRLIDAGDVGGFFIYGGTPSYRRFESAFVANIASSKRGFFTDVQNVSAELAQIILKANEDNRLINARGLVDRLRDIADGRWEINGQGIIIAKTGELNDGQHRLWAILLLGATVRIPIFYGAARASRGTLDTGKIRLTKDRFRFSGIPNDTRASSVVSLTHRILFGRDATEAEKVDFYYTDPDNFQDAVRFANNMPKGAPVASISTAGYLLLRAGRQTESVAKFLREVRGVDVPRKGSASFALLKLLLEKQAKALGNTPAEQAFTVADMFLRWEAGKNFRGSIQAVSSLPEALAI